ncbi:MAG: adenosylmethionine--8-amino-7-oxononanoate transaminase [Deltaproteobacteria bacterium]|nr:adenosylmethionine--8-amino-7-oxononanoate transaminase [Deltaproteobacteria bacterium]MBN2671129.1 adenosylmethionine--8-amino-7-oxononanoate transaminase [Deltaproteobacteria bacterium]
MMNRTQIVEIDKKYIWHPYTEMQNYIENTNPVVVERAEGFYLYDKDGTRYMDGNGSWWTSIVGHNHPTLMSAIVERTQTMVNCSFAGTTHEPAAQCAANLLPRCGPSFAKIFFSDDGSTAVEVAVRMAYQYWKNVGRNEKKRFVTLSGAFHGETLACASVSGVEVFHTALGDLIFDRIVLPSPGQPDADFTGDTPWYERAFQVAADLLERKHDEVAAIIVEPLVQGAAGMLMYPPKYLASLRALCSTLDILLICDEVFTGYGRTGSFLAHTQAGIEADIVTLAKGFSGGELPMAATITTQRIFDAFLGSAEKTLWYGHSFTGNPLGCAVANATLQVFDDEKLLESLPSKAAAIAAGLERLSAHPWVNDARQTGIISAFTLIDPRSQNKSGGYLSDAGWRFYAEARKRGALLRPLGNVVYFALPLTVTVSQIADLFDVCEASLQATF